MCIEGFEWNPDEKRCVVFCNMPYATTIKAGTIDECNCEDKFIWNPDTTQCEIVCDFARTVD